MVALFKRQAASFLYRLGLQRRPDYQPHPQGPIDPDALYDAVMARYPKIMKRLAE